MVNFVNDYVEAVKDGYIPESLEEKEICNAIDYIRNILKLSDDEEHMKCIGCKYIRYMWNQRRLDENDFDNDTKEQRQCTESNECISFFHTLRIQAENEYNIIVGIADNMERAYD